MSSILTRVSEDTPRELRVELLNDNTFKNDGRLAQNKFDKYELDHIYTSLGMDRQYLRQTSLGHTTVTYSNWTHFKAESQYSIWKIAVSNFEDYVNNGLYLDEKALDYRGEAASESLTALDKVYLYDGDSATGYTDNTTEAASEYAIPFNAMNSTNDFLYAGDAATFAGIDIDFSQFGTGYTLKVEYYSGASGDPWTELVSTANSLDDDTSNFTSSARITFDIPGDWATISLFSGDVAKYYIRISTTVDPSTVAQIYHVLPINNVPALLSMSQTELNEKDWSWCYYSGSIYVSIPNNGDRNYEGNRFINSLSSDNNIQNYFIYNHEYKTDYKDSSIGSGVTGISIYLPDTDSSHKLSLVWNENEAAANRTLNFLVHGGNRTLDLYESFYILNGFDFKVQCLGQANTLILNENLTVGDGYNGTITFSAASKVVTIAANLSITAAVTLDKAVGGIGIADDELVQIDHASVADNDFARFTADGLEGLTYAETMAALSAQASAAFSWNSQNLTNVGTIGLVGGQVVFPATQNASADANTLDDYEEGTWTPVYKGLTGSIGATAYSEQKGSYTKIGRQVSVQCSLLLTNNGDWTGSVRLEGLPFIVWTDDGRGVSITSLHHGNITYDGELILHVPEGGTNVDIYITKTATGIVALATGNVPDNGIFYFQATYFTN